MTLPSNHEYDDFTIRIRFRIPANNLNIQEAKTVVGISPNGREIKLKSADVKTPIVDSEWLILVSEGWKTEKDASDHSTFLLDSLCRSLAYHNLSADFGKRTAGGFFFRAALDKMTEITGKIVLNDELGIMIFPTDQKPLVARASEVNPIVSVNGDRWQATFQKAIDSEEPFSEHESMAFDLYAMAHRAQTTVDARFVLLFAAFETLLEPKPRPKEVCDLIDRLLLITRESNILETEKVSLLGTLKWMRTYSIRAAGRHLVNERLAGIKFAQIDAESLFLACYELRNRLVHGNHPYAHWKEVSRLAAPFELMVGSLLAGNLHGPHVQ